VNGVRGNSPVAPSGIPPRRRLTATFALALTLLAALAAAMAPAASATEMGHLSGIVTSAATGKPISGVEVCAADANGDGPWGCDVTDASGAYESSVYETGSYYVSFVAPSRSGYIARTYYGGEYAERESQAVPITIGQTTTNIDAALLEGGRISGRVVSASTKQPVEAVEVCARESAAPCTWTGANGEYEVSGLSTGQYEVQFGFGYGGSLAGAMSLPSSTTTSTSSARSRRPMPCPSQQAQPCAKSMTN
jgi:hypothetical protein